MELTQALLEKGFALRDAAPDDLSEYLQVKWVCYQGYVDQYFGGWVQSVQNTMNTEAFQHMHQQTCFQAILHQGKPVGFWGYDLQESKIDGVSIQMLPEAQGQGLGSCFLAHLTGLSEQTGKAAYLKVFRSNPAQRLYERFGFEVYDDSPSHFYMRYVPEHTGGV